LSYHKNTLIGRYGWEKYELIGLSIFCVRTASNLTLYNFHAIDIKIYHKQIAAVREEKIKPTVSAVIYSQLHRAPELNVGKALC
jgi:hypothetical protein